MLALVNAERCARGIPPLARNEALNAAANRHSIDMALNDTITNAATDGTMVVQRMQAAGYGDPVLAGQNVWGGVPDAGSVLAGLLGTNPDIILAPGMRELGVGHVQRDGTTTVHFWTLVFGSRGTPPDTCP